MCNAMFATLKLRQDAHHQGRELDGKEAGLPGRAGAVGWSVEQRLHGVIPHPGPARFSAATQAAVTLTVLSDDVAQDLATRSVLETEVVHLRTQVQQQE